MSKILIIDDDSDNRMLMKRRLEKVGHKVTEASNGQDGLEKIGKGAPDLIFVDLIMPGLDGWDVCSKLKKDPRTEPIPIILMSGIGSDIERTQRNREIVPPDAYLPKPWELAQMLELADKLLSSRTAKPS